MESLNFGRIARFSMVCALALVGGANVAAARCLPLEFAKLLASDGAPGDQYGSAVAVSDDVAVVGSRFDDDLGQDAGSAYVVRFNGSAWVQEAKLMAADGAANDYFSHGVAVEGDTIVSGSINDDDRGADSGSATVFHFDGSTWSQQQKLLASDGVAGDQFGYSVSISGDRIVIGARSDNGWAGSAYVFRLNGSTWVQEAKLVASDATGGDQFGTSVGFSGNAIVVGAFADGDSGYSSGSAYVFRFNGLNWVQEAKLLASDGAAEDQFGWAVAITADVVLVGAYGDDDNGNTSGSAYVFRFTGSSWVQEQKLLASDGAINNIFGKAVSAWGNIAVVGAHRDDDLGLYSGSAYVFRYHGSAWVEEAKLHASDGVAGVRFGYSVAVGGAVAVIGANKHDENGADSGATYVFHGLSDCNTNGTLDLCDVTAGTSTDCNSNGLPDECLDLEVDCNINGLPDTCETMVPGDLDGDGDVDLADYAQFAGCLTLPCPSVPCDPPLYGDLCCALADLDSDGDVDLADFGVFQVLRSSP